LTVRPHFCHSEPGKTQFLSVKAISYQYDAGRSLNMERAARIHQYGAPEVLAVEPVEVTAPGPGEVRIRHKAIGLNFVEVYFRRGIAKTPELLAKPNHLVADGLKCLANAAIHGLANERDALLLA
jgi:hypothetical protein